MRTYSTLLLMLALLIIAALLLWKRGESEATLSFPKLSDVGFNEPGVYQVGSQEP